MVATITIHVSVLSFVSRCSHLSCTIYITLVGCDWCISILTVLARSCSLSGPLLYRFPVVFLDRGHPRFGNCNSAIPVDVIRVKSHVNSFLDPSGAPVRVSINKLYLVKRVMASLVGVLRNGGGLGTGESYIPVVFVDSLMLRSSCFPDIDFSASVLFYLCLSPTDIPPPFPHSQGIL